MENKNDIIIINAFPNNNDKVLLLIEQILLLKKLNKPILLVSGCSVPEYIQRSIDYFLLNSENEIIGKDWFYLLRKNGINDIVFNYVDFDGKQGHFYANNVNSTITKNIKLGFNMAKLLGYKNAFYTEDDNIWKDGSFDYINHNLSKLKSGEYKMAGVLGEQIVLEESMMFTTFFFVNVDYFVNKFTLPHNASDWYNLENVKRYNLNRGYEILFYLFFKNDLNYFYNSAELFNKLLEPKSLNILFSLNDRLHSEKNLIDTFFTILPNKNNEKKLLLINRSDYLKNNPKTYNCEIYYDDSFWCKVSLPTLVFHYDFIPDEVKNIKVVIENYGEINLNCDMDSVKNNGLIIEL